MCFALFKETFLFVYITLNVENSSFFIVLLYPNPANSTVWISSETNLENISYKLIDIKGSLILSGKINGNKHEINIDALLNGVYFIHFDNLELAPFKLIKE
jgi:hypothetical protein